MRPACGLRVADHAFDERGPLAHNTQCHADRLVERSFLLLGQRLGRVAVPHLTTKPQWRFLDRRKHSSTRWAGDRHREWRFRQSSGFDMDAREQCRLRVQVLSMPEPPAQGAAVPTSREVERVRPLALCNRCRSPPAHQMACLAPLHQMGSERL